MRSIGHFIGGKEVKGTSGRTADVFEPMTGDVQAKVALASKAEVRAAVQNAVQAQVEWANTNPQRRARVMMKFLELAQRDYDKLADRLAREHGKTVPDAKGDIQRGLEVAEFACGIPHLMKGEYTEGAGPGIDIYSMRQPLGVVAGITPFNFPAMIPMWKFAPAIVTEVSAGGLSGGFCWAATRVAAVAETVVASGSPRARLTPSRWRPSSRSSSQATTAESRIRAAPATIWW